MGHFTNFHFTSYKTTTLLPAVLLKYDTLPEVILLPKCQPKLLPKLLPNLNFIDPAVLPPQRVLSLGDWVTQFLSHENGLFQHNFEPTGTKGKIINFHNISNFVPHNRSLVYKVNGW